MYHYPTDADEGDNTGGPWVVLARGIAKGLFKGPWLSEELLLLSSSHIIGVLHGNVIG